MRSSPTAGAVSGTAPLLCPELPNSWRSRGLRAEPELPPKVTAVSAQHQTPLSSRWCHRSRQPFTSCDEPRPNPSDVLLGSDHNSLLRWVLLEPAETATLLREPLVLLTLCGRFTVFQDRDCKELPVAGTSLPVNESYGRTALSRGTKHPSVLRAKISTLHLTLKPKFPL